MVGDALTLCRALGYDLNTVEFAVEDGVPYAIDFMNPAPDAGLESVGPENFEWIVDAVADMAVAARLRSRRRRNIAGISDWAADSAAPERDAPRRHYERSIEPSPASTSASKRNTRPSIPRPAICVRTFSAEIVQKGKMLLDERVKPEMHQSVVEIGTGVCKNIQEAKDEDPRHPPADHHAGAARTDCASRPAARIRSPSGATRRSIPTTATASSSRT